MANQTQEFEKFVCLSIQSQLEVFVCTTRTPSFSRSKCLQLGLDVEFSCREAILSDSQDGSDPLILHRHTVRKEG